MVKTKNSILPKHIRDELKMTCALQGFSRLLQGNSKTTKLQWDEMFIFYHGQLPNRPSQIKMLANGTATYRDLYDSSQVVVTTKSANSPPSSVLTLKPNLSLDLNTNYRAGIEIQSEDLEKKGVTGPLLITGRTLLAMAKRGVTNYKKALAFAANKWDIVKNEPKESGTTVDDVIAYVRHAMYNDIHDISPDDCDSLEEENYDEVENMADDNKETEDGGGDNLDEEKDTSVGNDDDNSADKNETPTKNCNNVPGKPTSITKLSNTIRNDWFFPGFISFVLYGPFADGNDRLACFELSDAAPGSNKGRAAKRKQEQKEKDVARMNDNTNKRGLTTDQLISMKALKLQRLSHEQNINESNLIALMGHSATLGRQIDTAERRATIRCEAYDENNVHWKHCDDLIEQLAIVTKQISSFTKDLKPLNTMDKKQSTIELLESSSGNESDCSSEDSINLDDIYDAPVVLDSSPNVKTSAPKAKKNYSQSN